MIKVGFIERVLFELGLKRGEGVRQADIQGRAFQAERAMSVKGEHKPGNVEGQSAGQCGWDITIRENRRRPCQKESFEGTDKWLSQLGIHGTIFSRKMGHNQMYILKAVFICCAKM